MFSVGYTLTGEALTALQRQGTKHIAFSVTDACPVRCSHCIVSATPPGSATISMGAERARAYASQFGRLEEMGVERISFTGGEPLLAPRILKLLSEAADLAGIESTVVTGCHWCGSAETATAVVRCLPHIGTWHLSADRFHQAAVPLSNVILAARAAVDSNRSVLIRMAVMLPLSSADADFYEELRNTLPVGIEILVQPVTASGRAERLEVNTPTGRSKNMPCMSGGMMIRADGSISPCCAALVAEPKDHPFHFGSAERDGLAGVYDAWRRDTLLRLIQCVGFAPVLRWVAEDAADHPILQAIPDHACDVCTALWRRPGTAELVRIRCQPAAVRQKVDELYETVFG